MEQHSSEQSSSKKVSTPKKNSKFSGMLLEMVVSILLPTLILKKLSGDDQLGPHLALLAALILPLGYGTFQFFQTKKFGIIPILGFINILLTGSIGLFELDSKYIAIKEATIPFVIGVLTLLSLKTPYPLVKTFLFNDMLMQVNKIETTLLENNNKEIFESVLVKATCILAGSFLLSSILNYMLAKIVVTANSGTAEFNDQLGTMNLLSYPVIALPCMLVSIIALVYLFKKIKQLTGYKLEEILNEV